MITTQFPCIFDTGPMPELNKKKKGGKKGNNSENNWVHSPERNFELFTSPDSPNAQPRVSSANKEARNETKPKQADSPMFQGII